MAALSQRVKMSQIVSLFNNVFFLSKEIINKEFPRSRHYFLFS